VGALVMAPPMTGVGENFEGGLAKVTAVDEEGGTVDVRLQVGGARQRGIAAARVTAFALDAPRRKRQTAGRCRLFGCGSLIVDCGHAQPDEIQAAPAAPADAREWEAQERGWRAAVGLDDDASSSSSEDVPLAALGRPVRARRRRGKRHAWHALRTQVDDGLSESDDDAAAARPLHRRNGSPATKLKQTAPREDDVPDDLARLARLPRTRGDLKRRLRKIQRYLEREAVPYLRRRISRLRLRVHAQAMRRGGAIDAAEAVGIRHELDDLLRLVQRQYLRRGVDVADLIYRRLERAAERRGASREALEALALTTDRIERDIHELAQRLKAIRDEDPRDDDGFADILERGEGGGGDGGAPRRAPRRREVDGAARRRRAGRRAAARPAAPAQPRRRARPEAPPELAPADAALALRAPGPADATPADAPWPADSGPRARGAFVAREVGRLARGVADAALDDDADAAIRGCAAAADAAARLERAVAEDAATRDVVAAAFGDAAPAARAATTARRGTAAAGPAAAMLSAVAAAGVAIGCLEAVVLAVALVDGAAHYSVRGLIDAEAASRAAARRWRRCDEEMGGGAVAWLARHLADERAFWRCLVFVVAALRVAPAAAWAACDLDTGDLGWACAGATALARVCGGGREQLPRLQARCAAAAALDARWDPPTDALLNLARRGAGDDLRVLRLLPAPRGGREVSPFAAAAEAIIFAARAGSQRQRLVTGLLEGFRDAAADGPRVAALAGAAWRRLICAGLLRVDRAALRGCVSVLGAAKVPADAATLEALALVALAGAEAGAVARGAGAWLATFDGPLVAGARAALAKRAYRDGALSPAEHREARGVAAAALAAAPSAAALRVVAAALAPAARRLSGAADDAARRAAARALAGTGQRGNRLASQVVRGRREPWFLRRHRRGRGRGRRRRRRRERRRGPHPERPRRPRRARRRRGGSGGGAPRRGRARARRGCGPGRESRRSNRGCRLRLGCGAVPRSGRCRPGRGDDGLRRRWRLKHARGPGVMCLSHSTVVRD